MPASMNEYGSGWGVVVRCVFFYVILAILGTRITPHGDAKEIYRIILKMVINYICSHQTHLHAAFQCFH